MKIRDVIKLREEDQKEGDIPCKEKDVSLEGLKMLTRTSLAAFAVALLLYISSAAAAEQQLGVAVYPGSEYDQARTKLLKDSLSVQGAAYRTRDGMAKVTTFYRKQGLVFLKFGSSEKTARFLKYDTNVEVVIQNPWKDAKTGAMMTDTLILIYKKDGKGSSPDVSI